MTALSGQAQVILTEKPEWANALQFLQLDLTTSSWLNETANENGAAQQAEPINVAAPGHFASRIDELTYQGLQGFTG